MQVITIELPPLRDRGDDILLLTKHFLHRFASQAGRPVPRLTDRTIDALRAHAWPGNVRELQNLLHDLPPRRPDRW